MQQQQQSRRQQAEQAAAACTRVLRERYGAREVYLFGSLAGHSPWHSRSDIDLAVEGLAPEVYFRALSELWDLLPAGMDLDLITMEDAPPELIARIRGAVKIPEDPEEALKLEITGEMTALMRIVNEAKLLLTSVSTEPSSIELSAAGKLVHDFYNGVERIFERVATRLGLGPAIGRRLIPTMRATTRPPGHRSEHVALDVSIR